MSGGEKVPLRYYLKFEINVIKESYIPRLLGATEDIFA